MQNSKLRIRNLKKRLPREIFNLIKIIGGYADKNSYRVFCVGGFVRDLLLGLKNFDLDIVVEKDALGFAKRLADKSGGSLVVHKKFGTATIAGGEFKIDIATARTERYEYPASLPTVKFASIKEDLYRRDFTINAMAISINKNTFGELIDFFNGQRDLRAKKIKVLHDLSFVEDPTRIFRAVRFEQRFSFKIEPHTEELIKTAVNLDMFGRTQKQRIRDEIILILSEDVPVNAVMRLNQLHELRFIHPKLKLHKQTIGLFKAIGQACIWYKLSFLNKRPLDGWVIYFMALVNTLTKNEIKSICEKFVFTKGDEKRIISCKEKAKALARQLDLKAYLAPSAIYKSLEPLAYEVILFIMATTKTKEAKSRIFLFFNRYNGTRLNITGKDLKAIGLAPGPKYKNILDKILYAKLDGKVKNKQEELMLAKKIIIGHLK